jgi:hypothetical protein
VRFTILLLSAVLSGAHAESSLLEIKGAKLKDPENASVLISDSGVCSIEDSRKPSFCGMYDTIRNFSAAWERSGRLCKEHFIPLDLPIPNPDGRTLVSLSGEGTALLLRCGARKSSGEDSSLHRTRTPNQSGSSLRLARYGMSLY